MTTCGCGSGVLRCRQCGLMCCDEHFASRAEVGAGPVYAGVGVLTSGRHRYVEIPGDPVFLVTLASGAGRRFTPPKSVGGVELTGGAKDAYFAAWVAGHDTCVTCRSHNGANAALRWRAELDAQLAVRRAEEAAAAQATAASKAAAQAQLIALRAQQQQVHDAHVAAAGGLEEIGRLTAERSRWLRDRNDAQLARRRTTSQRDRLGWPATKRLAASIGWVITAVLGGVTLGSLTLGAEESERGLLLGAGVVLLGGLFAWAWARAWISSFLALDEYEARYARAPTTDPRRPALAGAAAAAAAATLALGMHHAPPATVGFVVASIVWVAAMGLVPWADADRNAELQLALELQQATTATAKIDLLNSQLAAYRCGQAFCSSCGELQL